MNENDDRPNIVRSIRLYENIYCKCKVKGE